ncbi:hypothetical protein NQ318_008454 [Aromia moschata]|uniref:Large ribosomal subunit protein mL37 n=1 Tax=Aromia moschata TaxID=1265417 RepID=A0AAV8YAT0_9CUCU|nr:hypothetical protein NQ318_008454 [Aromia moschata]
MKKSVVLFRQHIGWHFTKHWRVQGKRKLLETGAEKALKEKQLPVYQAEDILKEERQYERIQVIGYKDKPVPLDENHPNWHNRPLLSYRDNNVLLEGLTQAKILTNTVQLKDGLPERISLKNFTDGENNHIKSIILQSHVFDAEQKKLPKIKDPERPAWNFPRSYGITQKRRNQLVISGLMQLVESLSTQDLVKDRVILNDLIFSYPFLKYDDLIQFQLTGDAVVLSSKPLSPITIEPTEGIALEDITPIKPTITLNIDNIYEIKEIYPIKSYVKKSHPHTVFINFDKEEVQNIYEEEITHTQIFGRSLLKAFTVSASYARQMYGKDVKLLPKPVTVQSVQTDGHFYHFGIFQLNTLDLEGGETKNIWYQTPLLNLFHNCSYKVGKPVLEGYNEEVVKHLYAFYNNN